MHNVDVEQNCEVNEGNLSTKSLKNIGTDEITITIKN